MENLNQPFNDIIGSCNFEPNYGQYQVPLGIKNIPSYTQNFPVSAEPEIAGWLTIVEGWHIAVKTKPDQKHLDNMQEMFGWEWIDKIVPIKPSYDWSKITKGISPLPNSAAYYPEPPLKSMIVSSVTEGIHPVMYPKFSIIKAEKIELMLMEPVNGFTEGTLPIFDRDISDET